MSINHLINLKEKFEIDYDYILSHKDTIIDFHDKNPVDINIFIPIKGRHKHLSACLHFFQKAIAFTKIPLKVKIHILENDDNPYFRQDAQTRYLNYLYIPLEISQSQNKNIAKSLLFNLGYKLSENCKWNIFHDADVLVPKYFFNHLMQYLNNNPNWVQPFTGKRIAYITPHYSNLIMQDHNYVDDLERQLREQNNNFATAHLPGAPGGSIVVRNDIFEEIGGYDPELFHGYAPEDAFFWLKLESHCKKLESIPKILGSGMHLHRGGAVYADIPPIHLFHLYHEPNYSRHDELNMADCLHNLAISSADEKKKFLKLCSTLLNFKIKKKFKKSFPSEININLYDSAFAHLELPHGKYSVVHDKLSKHTRYIKDHSFTKKHNISIFTEDYIFSDSVDKELSKYKIGWLIETREVDPERYRKVVPYLDKFHFIMTHDQILLDAYPEKTRLLPFGGSWIKEENFKLHDKPKMLSMIYSNKQQFTGHKLRHAIANKVANKMIPIDLFGSGCGNIIQDKEQGLKDYRFSIVVENSYNYNYFTEKLVDSFATATIPIYWGCPNIDKFFNKNGILIFNNIDELYDILPTLSIDLYNSMLPAIEENIQLAKKYEVNETLIYELFKQENMI